MLPRLSCFAAATIALLLALAPARGSGDLRQSTLGQATARGHLICGVSGGHPGFALQRETGEWSGLDVDFCRAVAAAIFDDPNRSTIVALAPKERLKALQSGEVDLLARGGAWTLSRDAGQGVAYVATTFFDGQGFLTSSKRAAQSRRDLSGLSVCVQQGTPFELDLVDDRRAGEKPVEPRLFASFEEAADAYAQGRCDALTADISTLAAARSRLEAPGKHAILSELIDKEPLGPIVRQDDGQWFDIVRWTLFGMVDAEELGVASTNVDEALKSVDPRMRRLLGVEGGRIEGFGLEPDWAYRIVKHVGNYGEIFERNLGHGSPLDLDRRLNALWTEGGLMYAPPAR
ncbi:amino acid ABC transporter substrate-binding protein [Methylosinus sp. Sm6]|uniref:amino acid ABC transporter substrate-binding protein n=1 Tax=Methylosinus sp. Sm6 TaxID=2866948 RepID=UPI001C98F1EC|nr:amino acid ABC transporter substrate-binding protein [Methylosinus sp. Sm6]MBY6240311.1 amino acid ABC transporter substrate-binding protein [Methylosinus sp. Sm6]